MSASPCTGFRYGKADGGRIAIVVGVRAFRLGRWRIPAFRLHYRLDGREYATVYQQESGCV